MSYNKIKSKIRILLNDNDTLRDEDGLLISHFWADELKAEGVDVNTITAVQFLTYFAAGYLTPADVILKAKTELQSRDITLRGKFWLKRAIN